MGENEPERKSTSLEIDVPAETRIKIWRHTYEVGSDHMLASCAVDDGDTEISVRTLVG